MPVAVALYRRYRPETFQELIGQSQVTDPLRTALRSDRVGHAYLFSGPRGCGKTTSARILARCLNCAEGPTDTPCGVCDSCRELGRDGGGSLDVVEIDAASHNGVDDARDLRERAVYAPARDRFKIFILDEAHMVTPQGFNALLKIVEEPPPHVKFIFATTEPEKVIGTIRSRTHHYPFRLVPPAQLLEYVAAVCVTEGVAVDPGVLPLVVRAGAGSVRDTLSILDQLIAGSEARSIGYDLAVALLGYTPDELLDDAVDALGERDAPRLFGAVDRVIESGQDPRRFVEDLLERLRDLVILAASPQGGAGLLRALPVDRVERMARQAAAFGPAALSKSADAVNAALTAMGGATAPRLHLELLAARLLVGLGGAAGAAPVAVPAAVAGADRAPQPDSRSDPPSDSPSGTRRIAPVAQDSPPEARDAGNAARLAPAAAAAPTAGAAPEETQAALSAPVTAEQIRHAWPQVLAALEDRRMAWIAAQQAQVRSFDGDVLALAFGSNGEIEAFRAQSDHLRTAILAVLGVRVKFTARASDQPTGAIPTATAATQTAAVPGSAPGAGERPGASAAELDGDAVPAAEPDDATPPVEPDDVAASLEPPVEPDEDSIPSAEPPSPAEPARSAEPEPPVDDWNVVAIATSIDESGPPEGLFDDPPAEDGPDLDAAPVAVGRGARSTGPAPKTDVGVAPTGTSSGPRSTGPTRGEAVVREVLGARFIADEPLEMPGDGDV